MMPDRAIKEGNDGGRCYNYTDEKSQRLGRELLLPPSRTNRTIFCCAAGGKKIEAHNENKDVGSVV